MSKSQKKETNADEKKEVKLYFDVEKSKGNTFEKNVNIINNMYFGKGIDISDNPFIIINEKDQNKYLSILHFVIKTKEGQVLKEVFMPASFLQPIFYYENILFHFSHDNKLIVIEIGENDYKQFWFKENAVEKKVTTKEEESKIKALKAKLESLNGESNLKKKYESLIDIFTKDLDCSLLHKNPKKINKTFIISLDGVNNEYIIEIESILDTQIDDFGVLREQIKLNIGTILLDDGINCLKSYVNAKKNGKEKETNYDNNDFKCPIIYKNFADEIIPQDNAILIEIKSGFALKDVIDQLDKRIKIINNCDLIKNGQRPVFFIGIVNILSDNIDKEMSIKEKEIKVNANLLLVSCVDYKYCGIDISREMHGEYLLYKKINSLEEKMVSNFNDINKKINEMDTKINKMDTKINTMDKKIDGISNNVNTINGQIQALINLMKTNFPNIQLLGLNGINSNNFDEQNEN